MTYTGGIGHTLSSCLLGCGTQDEAEDEAEVCVLCCQTRSPSQFVMSTKHDVLVIILNFEDARLENPLKIAIFGH